MTGEALDADGKQFAAGQPLELGGKLSGPFTGEARIVLRTPRNQVVHEARAPVTPDAPLAFAVPAQPAGGYFADVWLLHEGKVVDWASAWLTVAAPAVQLALELPSFSAGPEQTLAARAVATGAPAGASVVARLVGAAGRSVVSLPAVPLREGRAELALPLARTRELRYLLEAEVGAGGQRLATAQTPVFVNRPWTPDLFVYTDGEARNYGGKLRFDLCRELGITTVELGSDGATPYPDLAMASGLRPGYRVWTTHCDPYTGGCLASPTYGPALSATFAHLTRQLLPYGLTFFSIGDDSGVAQDFCASPPNWVRSYIVKLSTHYRGDSAAYFKAHQMPNKWGNFRYMMQEGTLAEIAAIAPTAEELPLLRQAWQENYADLAAFNRAHGTAFASYEAVTPAALAAAQAPSPRLLGFQDAMRQQYGTIAALNAAWGTTLADFTAITPTLADELLAQGSFAAKLDRNWYLEELFLANMAAAAKGVREVSPDVGIGMGAASVGNIIPEVLERIDSVMPYKGDRDLELIRSAPHRFCGQTIGVYGGKAVPQAARENQAWETVFSGGNFIWFWSMITGGLEGDLSLNPGRSGYLLAAIQELQGGIAQALIRAQRQHDGIAILHQRRAGGLSSFHKELGSQESSQVGFQRIFEDLGLQYRYTWTREVESGVLDRGEFKLLVLPYTQILSEGEVAAIERFVAAGGTVLADLRCATHDWQGRPLPGGRLDALFGIHQAPTQAVPAKGELRWAAGSVPQLRGDGSVTAAGAEARATLGTVPAVLVRPSGKGRAIFLNHAPTTYYSLLNRQAAGPLRQLYLGLLAEAGIRPRFSVTDAAGQPVAGAELAAFREGPLEYLTIEKSSYEYERYPLAATVQLDRSYAVYDVRAGQALGLVERFPVTLTGLGSYVYALLPAVPGPLAVTAPATVAPGGAAVVTVAVGSPAPHQVRVEVFRPDGQRLWPLYKLPARDGVATVTVPIANNDPPGPWRLVVTDVTTGRSHTQTLEVTR